MAKNNVKNVATMPNVPKVKQVPQTVSHAQSVKDLEQIFGEVMQVALETINVRRKQLSGITNVVRIRNDLKEFRSLKFLDPKEYQLVADVINTCDASLADLENKYRAINYEQFMDPDFVEPATDMLSNGLEIITDALSNNAFPTQIDDQLFVAYETEREIIGFGENFHKTRCDMIQDKILLENAGL